MALNLGYISPVPVWSIWGHLGGKSGGGGGDPPRLGGEELKISIETPLN